MLILLLVAMLFSPFQECPEEVTRIPEQQAAWGYYHLDMHERMCGVSIWAQEGDEFKEYLYPYPAPGDADFSLDWMGPNIVWIDNTGGRQVAYVSYWTGYNGWPRQFFIPAVWKGAQ